jgi:hypothetical protein
MRNDGGFPMFTRRIIRIAGALIAAAQCSTPAFPADAPDIEQQVERAVGQSLQGDAAAAVKTLAAVPADKVSGENAELRTCVLQRFGANSVAEKPASTGDAWIDSLALAYQTYWHRSLTHPKQVADAEKVLRAKIGAALGRKLATDTDVDAADADLEKQALAHGYHVLLGRTPPLLELMLWHKTTVDDRTVPLPDGPEVVRVNLLDDFVLRGWAYYVTCGQRSAGGWATDDGLFAVVPAYRSITDETFNVRVVAHEGQHFADKRVFKTLESWELEYRGKLAEFALADEAQGSTRQLICENREDSKDSPHGYANSQVVRIVSARLGSDPEAFCRAATLPGQPLRDAAKALLLEDTAQRRAATH